ncbi:hypothetical protein ANCCEY_09953 [Ancylostoma ceylanicum]|uniref:7TM GPCR serpentine receptor class x (Srx) domain-containing protein n=1 Tax=Ancylostoma ceylanicum TaxID=53326 RepID=A0A0D6LG64_9BILA|nr:hypothetical protein ANCCEY_09953 [Ancylostoma ceylanicum]
MAMLKPFDKTTQSISGYHNIPHTINNTVVIASLLLFYPSICGIMAYRKLKEKSSNIDTMTKQIMAQSMVICGCHIVGCFLYVYTQYFPVPNIFTVIGNLAWIGNHGESSRKKINGNVLRNCLLGLPGIVYISLSKTIRKKVLVLVGIKKKHKVFTVKSFTVNEHHRNRTDTNT